MSILITDCEEAYSNSHYTILGAGGDLDDYVDQFTKLLQDEGVGTPLKWSKTTGMELNAFARKKSGTELFPSVLFDPNLNVLTFPLEGLQGGLIAFKWKMRDRWFDDVINNMIR